MAIHPDLQFGYATGHLWHWGFVALCQLLYALGELLADSVHLAVDDGIERGEPFVVHHQRLDISLSEPRVVSINLGVEAGLGLLEAFFPDRHGLWGDLKL